MDCTPFVRLFNNGLSGSRRREGASGVHQMEIFDLTASSLIEDGKSPQYEAPHERVASNNGPLPRANEHQRVEIRAWDSVTLC